MPFKWDINTEYGPRMNIKFVNYFYLLNYLFPMKLFYFSHGIYQRLVKTKSKKYNQKMVD